MKPLDTIVNIRVKTLEDFNTNYPAGSEVSVLFSALNYQHQPTKLRYNSLKNSFFEELSEYKDYYTECLYLYEKPETPRNVQFDIEVTLSNGNVLNATTQKVFLSE